MDSTDIQQFENTVAHQEKYIKLTGVQ